MKSSKTRFLILLSVVIALGFAFFIYYFSKSSSTTSSTSIHYENYQTPKINSISLFGDNKQFVAIDLGNDQKGSTNISVSQNYVARVVYKQRDDEQSQEYQIDTGESVEVTLYDLNNESLTSTTIDLLDVMKNNNLNGYLGSVSLITYEGKDYLIMIITHDDTSDQKQVRKLYEIDSKVLVDSPDILFPENRKNNPNLNKYVHNLSASSAFKLSGMMMNLSNSYDIMLYAIRLSIPQEKISLLKDTNFFVENPNLETLSESNIEIYMRPLSENFGDWFNTVGYWFAPKGQSFIDTYAEDTTTGEKTQIKSYSDYENWIALHPDELKRTDPRGSNYY
ncbi:hypothetical protein [Streptococcus loxodontisalivarius]|uniref:Uncharacterized protein n=1 Tax=Streptococcus loxodontisalivarius TaxID=1349415 RepID=A0ABS2PSF0_9STRE|nr:hypothetical protein [Streptococcus loxodontisalivarius]MBM7642801.1 hypothetical protein [Streptococcus loxodontisalivarius]